MGNGARKWIRSLANLLIFAGTCLLAIVAAFQLQSHWEQLRASYDFDRRVLDRGVSVPATPVKGPVESPIEKSDWLGRLEIPRLNMSVMVREGDDKATMRVAVGHIPGTARPGQQGAVALAGHRDTFFRALRDIRKNDLILMETAERLHEYRVEQVLIVDPRQTEVLNAGKESVLTLITCYPFDFVGAAPKRFVVRAKETAAVSSGTPRAPGGEIAGLQRPEPR